MKIKFGELALLFTFGILFSALCSNVAVYAQNKTATSITAPASSTNPEQHITKIKITSPTKGQQISVGKDIAISGISIDNTTAGSTDCKVSVIANKVRPYQRSTAAGPGGAVDYSKWNFVLTSKYTTIKPGENRITAKYECANNPNLTSFSSVNVTGVPSATTNPTNSTTTRASTITNPSTSTTTTDTKSSATIIAQAHTTKTSVATKPESPMLAPESAISGSKKSTRPMTNSISDLQSKQKTNAANTNDNTTRSSAVNGTRVAPMQIPVSGQNNYDQSAATIAPQVKLIPQQNTKSLSQEHYQPAVQNTSQHISKPSTLAGRNISPIGNIGLTGTQRNESVGVPHSLQSTSNFSRSNLLLVSIKVGNDPITAGDRESVIISVSDARSNDKVAGANIAGQVTKSSGVPNKGFRVHTDYNGQASYSWKIKQTAGAPDIYKVAATVAAPGYQQQVAAASFTVNPSISSNAATAKLVNTNKDIDTNSADLLGNRVH